LGFPNYTKEVVINCVEGWNADLLWQGVLLSDLFEKVKVKPDANTVIFYAADGYTTSLPLQTILDKKMIMAFKVNGVVLPAKDGYPFHARCGRQAGLQMVQVDHPDRAFKRQQLQRLLGKQRIQQ